MASTQTGSAPGKSPGLTLNLSSNNPFRNRAVSPSPSAISSTLSPTATSPFDDPTPRQRPVSRNPFLDPNYSSSQPNLIDTSDMSVKFDSKASPTAEELFDTLNIDDKKPPRPEGAPPRPPANRPPGPPGRENVPPGRRGPPPPGHRPTRSQEEALRAKKAQMQGGPRTGPSASPQRRPDRRPRRNSDSSVLELEKPLTEEEIKAREARRKEREKRHRDRDGKEKKPSRRLDIIDQLDHTSLFGGGFHHDGPFDAVASHRNRKGSRRAPMQAFPKDSLNMSIGGSGPLNRQADQATLMGTSNDEAFKEYSSGSVLKNGYNYPKIGDVPVFDPRGRSAVLHGEESLGLGTSTFLEGTPAARTAIQKREAEQAAQNAASDLQRKKSLAHRIRNINRGQPSGRMTNPEGAYSSRSPEGNGERNPFFNEYGKEPENLSIRRTDTKSPTSPPPPVPRRGSDMGATLERRATNDALASPTEESSKPSGGFLSRVKSLKGGRRNRQPTDAMPPGTAV